MSTVVETLGPDNYSGFIEAVGDGKDAITHKGLVRFHGDQRSSECYVKIYCSSTAPKGVVNELIGYLLSRSGGFDSPNRAAILLLNDDQIDFLPISVTPGRTSEGLVVAWCVEALNGGSPKQHFCINDVAPEALSELRKDLERWEDLADVTSLDAWLLNEDRNLGNLIRLGAGRYALIDHGRLFLGNSWACPLDKQRMKHVNKLSWIAWDQSLENAPEKYHGAIIQSFSRHGTAYRDSSGDLDYWLPLLVSPAEEVDALDFLESRIDSVRIYLQQNYGVLL